jgi:hypothetical protein
MKTVIVTEYREEYVYDVEEYAVENLLIVLQSSGYEYEVKDFQPAKKTVVIIGHDGDPDDDREFVIIGDTSGIVTVFNGLGFDCKVLS